MVDIEDVIGAIEAGSYTADQLQRLVSAVVNVLTADTQPQCSGTPNCNCGCGDVVPMSKFTPNDDTSDATSLIIKRIDNESPFDVHFSEDEKVNALHVDRVENKNGMVFFSLNEVTYIMPYQTITEADGSESPVVRLDVIYNGEVRSNIPFKVVSTGTRKVEIGNL